MCLYSRHSGIGDLSVAIVIIKICITFLIIMMCIFTSYKFCMTILFAMLIHVYIVNNRAQGPEWPIAI